MLTKRCDKLDSIRAVLIFLVVFGHALEKVAFPGREGLYLFIYTFHMPAFALLSGLCFKPADGKRLFCRYLYPYAIFQVLYLWFTAYETGKAPVFEFTTPQHVLWYLLALVFWNAAVTLLHLTAQTAPALLAGSTALALLAGFEPTIGRYLSLSRTLVFFPFFLAGACIKQLWMPQLSALLAKPCRAAKALCAVLAGCIVLLCTQAAQKLDADWFYEASPYAKADTTLGFRLLLFAFAAVMITFLLLFMPNRRIPFLSWVGQHTMPIYLVHDFVIRLLAKLGWFARLRYPFLGALCVSIALVAVLSCGWVQTALAPLMAWPFSRRATSKAAPAAAGGA